MHQIRDQNGNYDKPVWKKKNLIKEASKNAPNDSLLPRGPSGHVSFENVWKEGFNKSSGTMP